MSKLLKYAGKVHDITRSKGFWDNERNKAEMVMLIVSELGECLEAHRKGLIASREFQPPHGDRLTLHWFKASSTSIDSWLRTFEARVKDHVEDEMADVVIRILDYVHGWDIPVTPREFRKESTGNFGHDLLRINWYIINSYHAEFPTGEFLIHDWGYVLAAIEAFCTWYDIDIDQHVQWKIRYNSTRPAMHNKKY